MKNCFRFLVFVCFLTVFFLGFSENGRCLVVPDKPRSYVNDYAGLLTPEVRQKLEILLAEFERSSGNQIVVALFDGLEGQSLEDFSIRLAQNWKIGSKKNNNGVILLVFKKDRQVRIEVGYGLEGALPDALCGQIIRQDIVSVFRSGQYDKGIEAAVKSIMRVTAREYRPNAGSGTVKATTASDDSLQKFAPFVLGVMFFYFVFPIFCYLAVFFLCVLFIGGLAGWLCAIASVMLLMFLRRMFFGAFMGQTISSGRHGGYSGSGFGSFGGGGFGGGGFSSGGFSGGGFSGGGGGSFGGGGASGSW